MSSLSYDFNQDLLCLALAEVWMKQRIEFVNPNLQFLFKRENHCAESQQCVINPERPRL
jgi:hypothetical protein